MTRAQDKLLEIHLIVTKGNTGLGTSGIKFLLQVGRIMHLAHTLAAAASRCLDEDRVPNGVSKGTRLLNGFNRAVASRNGGDACSLHGLFGVALLAHRIDNLGSGTDEHKVVIGTGTCKFGVLGQKAITGMDRFASARDRSTDDASIIEITLCGRGRSDANALVSFANSGSIRIRLGIGDAAFHAKIFASTNDTQRNLAAVGDQNLLEHPDIGLS